LPESDPSDTVTRVVRRLQAGDATGSVLRDGDRLLRRIEPAARSACRSSLPHAPPQQIEELVQETLEIAWRRMSSFEDQGRPFEAWIRGIARYLCANARRRKKELLTSDGVLEATDPELGVLQNLTRDERGAVVSSAIQAGLGGVERDALYHRYVHDLSREQIAVLLEMPGAEEVRVVLQRARRQLRTELKRRLSEIGAGESFLRTNES
jgi:RNA polymerase sigma-70 factor, ECF subfamily